MLEFVLLIWAILSMCIVGGNMLLWLLGMGVAMMWYLLAHNFSISMGWRSGDGKW